MVIIKNENVEPFDVDGTLVLHQSADTIPLGEALQVYDAITKKFITVRINRPMVRLLRESKARGSYVIVWSKGGYRWATDVIKALDLVDFVDLVLTKPAAYYDDTEIQNWLPYRVYIAPEVIYKQMANNGRKQEES